MVVTVMITMMAGASDTAMANSKNVMAQHAVNLRFYSLNLGTEVRKRRGCRVKIKIYIWPFQNWMSCRSFRFELDLNQSMDSKTCLSSGWPDCHLSSHFFIMIRLVRLSTLLPWSSCRWCHFSSWSASLETPFPSTRQPSRILLCEWKYQPTILTSSCYISDSEWNQSSLLFQPGLYRSFDIIKYADQ